MKMPLRFTASTVLALITGTTCLGQHYKRINLVSNTAGVARATDPQLINPRACLAAPAVRGGYLTKGRVLARRTTEQAPNSL